MKQIKQSDDLEQKLLKHSPELISLTFYLGVELQAKNSLHIYTGL